MVGTRRRKKSVDTQSLKSKICNQREKKPKRSILSPLSEIEEKFDENATAQDCINDLVALQNEHPEKFIVRDFYRHNGKYSDKTWGKYFGTFKEFRRQAGLELNRFQHSMEHIIANHANNDIYTEFYKTEVLPYYNKYEKKQRPSIIKRMLIASDIHDKECNEFCLEVFIDTARRQQPDIIVLNGDIADMYEFSKFDSDIRNFDIKGRFDFIKNRVFRPLRKACPDAQIDYITGNHEWRLMTLLANKTPAVRVLLSDVMGITFADVFGLDEFEINLVSKIDFGCYNPKEINNRMKKNYKVYFDCYVVSHQKDNGFGMSGTSGHRHRARLESDFNIMNGPITWVETPAMHHRDAEYINGTCKWNMGFLDVVVNTKTRQVIQNLRMVHDDWAFVDGVYYQRLAKK